VRGKEAFKRWAKEPREKEIAPVAAPDDNDIETDRESVNVDLVNTDFIAGKRDFVSILRTDPFIRRTLANNFAFVSIQNAGEQRSRTGNSLLRMKRPL
jgi:hypothetical protein